MIGRSTMEYFLPFGTRHAQVLATFVVALLVFHVSLIWWPWRLTKTGWRVVDYIWLLVGGLGLIVSVGQARQAIAGAAVASAIDRLDTKYGLARKLVRQYAQDEGLLCRAVDENEWTSLTEVRRQQAAFAAGCGWAKRLAEHMPEQTPQTPISPSLLQPPATGDYRFVDDLVRSMVRQVEFFNEDAAALVSVRRAVERHWTELAMVVAGPLLLALALALRMTKVTGEWMIDVRAARLAREGVDSVPADVS